MFGFLKKKLKRSAAAENAVLHPPSCLANFSHSIIPYRPESPDCFIDFGIECKSCKGDVFNIIGFPEIMPDPSLYPDIKPGEVFLKPPHKLKCVSCGSTGSIFDPSKQGYDALLNDSCSYEIGTENEGALEGAYRIIVSFGYNDELSELKELALGVNVSPSDLFDFIEILGKSTETGHIQSLAYECS